MRGEMIRQMAACALLAVLVTSAPGMARQGELDAKLETATMQRLRQSAIPHAHSVEAVVEDGETRLEGELKTLADIWRVVELAERVHGVIEVHSELELVGEGRSRDVIESDIQRAFANRPVLLINEIEVDVRRGGRVVLRGELKDARTRFAARETVAAVRGVTEVIDRLETPEASDELISKGLEEVFRRAQHQGLEGKIDAEVSAGVVTLTGVVPRPYERRKAEELALGVNGVRRVKNRLGIRPDARQIPVVRP